MHTFGRHVLLRCSEADAFEVFRLSLNETRPPVENEAHLHRKKRSGCSRFGGLLDRSGVADRSDRQCHKQYGPADVTPAPIFGRRG